MQREIAIERARQLTRSASYVVAFTGAGISTPSGIPDFRSAGSGQWTQFDPMQVASLTAFRRRPQVFYDWLRPLARAGLAAQPNPAHFALAALEASGKLKAVITQNVDGLHRRAGSRRVLEVHGTMDRFTCPRCGRGYPLAQVAEAFLEREEMPRCPACEAVVKPDMVLYEEMLPEEVWRESSEECARADLLLVIGTSLDVGPANLLPVMALEAGAQVIINTFSQTFLDDRAAVLLPYDVAEVVPVLL